MAELRGGTTIGGYTALHSGLKEAYLGGNLTMNGNITIPAGGEIKSLYNNAYVIKDHGNGNITLSATGAQLYLGHQNTTGVRLSQTLFGSNGTTTIADTTGKLYYQGADIDTRYMKSTVDAYVGTDLTGSTTYPRLVAKNSGATTPDWIRVSTDANGILPYSNGNSFLGTSSWKFKEIHAVNFYENGTLLSSKYAAAAHNHDTVYAALNHNHDATYAAIGHNHDSVYFKLSGGTLTGNIIMDDTSEKLVKGSGTNTGLYFNINVAGMYDWKNNRGVWQYIQGSNILKLDAPTVTSSTVTMNGAVTVNNTLDMTTKNIVNVGELQVGTAGANLKVNATSFTVANSSAMTMRIVGTSADYNNNYVAFYQSNNTTRQGWIGFPTGTNSQLGITNDSGDIAINAGSGKIISVNTFNIEIGKTKYYNGTSGGDSIYNPTGQLILGGNTNVALWAETGNFSVRTGAVSASTIPLSVTATQTTIQSGLLIDNISDIDGTNDRGLTLRDASDNVASFDSNEMFSSTAANVRGAYTFNVAFLQMNTGGGAKRIPRVSWGTAAPSATNAIDGDIYVQY